MGAKQSKRSVDISGKEAEGGEVAVAGAGGEGRVEQLADADALKPQLNGAAHIQLEETDKKKELDSGTPENEKDATTEKEGKEEDDAEKEAAPVINGESEPKVENGESTPTPEESKKPKKEKVKKKWSLRSISFSRKDKPKQEKKQKDEEPKTNGEPEKVPEETAEAAASEVAEEAKAPNEVKDEKTPETPETEPLTNGTSTPESTNAETPASETAAPALALAPAPSPPADVTTPEPAEASEPQPEPDQLPVNGLSIEEPKPEIPEVEKPEETKPEPPAALTAEIVPAPEIPKEVCVDRLPLLEPTPPPLPANPPPSSVASFAATTMAPELTDASLANTADAAIAPISALPETKDILTHPEPNTETAVTETLENEISFVLKETTEDAPDVYEVAKNALEAGNVTKINALKQTESPIPTIEIKPKETAKTIAETQVQETPEILSEIAIVESLKISPAVVKTPEILTEIPVVDSITEAAVKESPEVIVDIPVVDTITETVVAGTPETITEIKVDDTITETTVVQTPKTITGDAVVVTPSETINKISDIVETVVPVPTHTDILEKNEPLETIASPINVIKTNVPETVPAINNVLETESVHNEKVENVVEISLPSIVAECLPENIPETELEISDADDSSLPPPPMQDEDDSVAISDDVDAKVEESLKQIPEPITEPEVAPVESNHISKDETTNGSHDVSLVAADETETLKKKARASMATAAETIECNGSAAGEECPPPAADEPRVQNGGAPDHHHQHTPQDPLPVSDKLADLIPEVPDVPELKPETLQETVTDVAVVN